MARLPLPRDRRASALRGDFRGALQGARGRPRLVGGWPRSVSENVPGGLGYAAAVLAAVWSGSSPCTCAHRLASVRFETFSFR